MTSRSFDNCARDFNPVIGSSPRITLCRTTASEELDSGKGAGILGFSFCQKAASGFDLESATAKTGE
jgi:hypothetical protein